MQAPPIPVAGSPRAASGNGVLAADPLELRPEAKAPHPEAPEARL